MSFAPPVSKNNFHYNGNLYVEVGQLNRHQRASVDEISAILRPDLAKKSSAKKTSLDPPKDQVGHWYEAQLIHYGLPPSMDKARAKMRLLEALNSSKLEKEYAAAERKAKALYKASSAPQAQKAASSAAAGQKRKQSESSSFGNVNNINVNISLGSPGPIDRATGLRIPHPSEMISGTASKTPPAKPGPVANKTSKVKQEPTLKAEKPLKKESQPKKEPSSKPWSSSSTIKREPKAEPSLGLINGIYDLSCPTISENWPHDNLTLTLTLDGTTIWGAYDLSMFTGILFLPSRPWQASSSSAHPLPFTWHGRENGEGEMSFGHGCDGELSFLGDGVAEGWVSVYGRCEFRGVRRKEAGTKVRASGHMRAEWEGYNERAYEEDRVGR